MISNSFDDSGCCETHAIHEDVIKTIKQKMPQNGRLDRLAQLFKTLGDPTRIKIIWALFEAEICVCDIAALLEMSQSAISHQLRVLKQARLVKSRKEGKMVFYSLDDSHVKQIFDQGLLHICHS